jgi:DNA helicase TIP49 (TBP-interacting protein)
MPSGSFDFAAQVEGIGMQEAALARLGEIGESASLRHAVQLLTPAHVLAKSAGRCRKKGNPRPLPPLQLWAQP